MKLKVKIKSLEIFVAQVTARTASNLLEIQPYYFTINQTYDIEYHLVQEANE